MVLLDGEDSAAVGRLTTHSIYKSGTNFSILVRGKEFTLSPAQIQFDSPNLFTEHFTPSLIPSTPLVLDRNPDLFAIIVEYLSGYDILPLAETALPRTLSMEAAKHGLLKDADTLGLTGLRSLLRTSFAPPSSFLSWIGTSPKAISLLDFLEGQIPAGCRRTDQEFTDQTGREMLIHARGVGILFGKIFELVNPASFRPPPSLNLDINTSKPFYRLVIYEHPQLIDILIYGQSQADAQITLDGKSVDVRNVPAGVPMIVDEAWMSYSMSWTYGKQDQHDVLAYQVKIISLKATTKPKVIEALDYQAMIMDSDEMTLMG